ncbi:hypothetical protein M422DRAFT_47122 [Sphaerobolus stellatus SS14]|uniref:Uncharacterized protein n=1 Tax=Sphaerobolus stellatus (strain SS14) TaxID=990650 RepID=A0A0C9UQ21_SPHS4|nr:hypothetical protein M422DRAFT_47122 [Sphaerobolus stellatus SS14]
MKIVTAILSYFLEHGESASVGDDLYNVSHYWREVLRSVPQAWSTIIVQESSAESMEEFRRCIDLSKGMNIELYIAFVGLDAKELTDQVQLMLELVDIIKTCFQYVTRFYIGFDYEEEYDLVFENAYETIDSGPFPALRELCVRTPLTNSATIPVFVLPNTPIQFPNIQWLNLDWEDLPILNALSEETLDSVKKLTMSLPYLPNIDDMQLIGKFPRLDGLHIFLDSHILPSGSISPSPTLLTSLHAKTADPSLVAQFIRSLSPRSLHRFSFQ